MEHWALVAREHMSLQPMWDSKQREETATPVTAHAWGQTYTDHRVCVWTRMSPAACSYSASKTRGSAESWQAEHRGFNINWVKIQQVSRLLADFLKD